MCILEGREKRTVRRGRWVARMGMVHDESKRQRERAWVRQCGWIDDGGKERWEGRGMNIQASERLDRSGEDKAGEQEGQRETTCNQTNKQKRKKK